MHPVLRTVEPQTINYEIEIIDGELDAFNQKLISDATSKAFDSWKKNNPELVFQEGSGGVKIIFTQYLLSGVNGLALCPFWVNSEDWCYIFISTGIINQYHYPANKNMMANILAHETGHVLGMMHVNTSEHLMSGPVFGWNFNDRGFVVPKLLGPYD